MNDEDAQANHVTIMTAEIAAAFVSHTTVTTDQVPEVIKTVYRSLEQIAEGRTDAPATPKPAVSIRRSVRPDHIVCLEDGERYRSLKRHLRSQHGMTPDEYRAKWNLSSDYPMVCPRYAAQRAALAKATGLGRRRKRTSIKA